MKTLSKDTPFFIFDVESIGIHGEPFAVAGGVYIRGEEQRCFHCSMDPDRLIGDAEDKAWIKKNVPYVKPNCALQFNMLNDFYFELDTCRSMHPDLVVCAECPWPVESTFLSKVIAVNPVIRKWDGPYPLIDITSIMYAAGLDPMATWEREPREQPAHNPLCDVRLSARILNECLNRLNV